MPTLIQVRNAVDAELADLWQNAVIPRQDAYFAAHGRYWQGMRTHTFEFDYSGALDPSEAPDNLDAHPTDQIETWADTIPEINAPRKAVIWIDAYNGPLGMGYVGHVLVRYNGTFWHRAQNRGPESWRTQAWESL